MKARFSYLDIITHAYAEIESLASTVDIDFSYPLKILLDNPVSKNTRVGYSPRLTICEQVAKITIEIVITANDAGETFPIFSFSKQGKKSVFNGESWFVENEQAFLKVIHGHSKIGKLKKHIEHSALLIASLGGV
jgi:hypothetical protein